MLPLLIPQVREWLKALSDFDGTFKSVTDNLAALAKLQTASERWPADMREQYRSLVMKGTTARAKLLTLRATRDKVRSWLVSIGQLAKSAVGMNGLNALPLIYVGIGLGAFVAAIEVARRFLTGASEFSRRLQVYERTQRELTGQGVDPAEAARRASEVAERVAGDKPGLLERLGSKAIWIGGGVAVLIFVLPQLLAAARNR